MNKTPVSPILWFSYSFKMAKFTRFITLALIAVLFIVDVKPMMNATNARKGQFPYMASLMYRSMSIHSCGGAIINERYVITGGYCIEQFVAHPEKIVAYLGAWKFSDKDSVKSDVADIKVHPDFVLQKKHHDIALVRMVDKIIYTDLVQPVNLPTSDFPDVNGESLVVSGFGAWFVSIFSRILA